MPREAELLQSLQIRRQDRDIPGSERNGEYKARHRASCCGEVYAWPCISTPCTCAWAALPAAVVGARPAQDGMLLAVCCSVDKNVLSHEQTRDCALHYPCAMLSRIQLLQPAKTAVESMSDTLCLSLNCLHVLLAGAETHLSSNN